MIQSVSWNKWVYWINVYTKEKVFRDQYSLFTLTWNTKKLVTCIFKEKTKHICSLTLSSCVFFIACLCFFLFQVTRADHHISCDLWGLVKIIVWIKFTNWYKISISTLFKVNHRLFPQNGCSGHGLGPEVVWSCFFNT